MLSCAEIDGGLTFTFPARARDSRLSYTHETSLYLYGPAEPSLPTVQISICFWR